VKQAKTSLGFKTKATLRQYTPKHPHPVKATWVGSTWRSATDQSLKLNYQRRLRKFRNIHATRTRSYDGHGRPFASNCRNKCEKSGHGRCQLSSFRCKPAVIEGVGCLVRMHQTLVDPFRFPQLQSWSPIQNFDFFRNSWLCLRPSGLLCNLDSEICFERGLARFVQAL
jgi:hypothetical protein